MTNSKPETRNSKLEIIYSPGYSTYHFGKHHPANPEKREHLVALFDALGAPLVYHLPEPATDEDLLTVHTREFLHCVASASMLSWSPGALRFGLDTDDVPIFPGMDEAARLIVGGTLMGARMIARGDATRVLQLGGGFHHAMPARAAGFCIYNDLSVAIQYFRNQGWRVAYIDIDVHHGDGVQWVHYRDPEVLTISLHESGRYLFPNTGAIDELGEGAGRGTAINMPFEQHTDDTSFLEAFEAIVPLALERFAPDVLIIPGGVDAHYQDPLAHLMLTTHALERVFKLFVDYADQFTGGNVLFTQGGGYHELASIRCWALLIHILQEQPLPETLPADWLHTIGHPPPVSLHDHIDDLPSIPQLDTMRQTNRETLEKVLSLMNSH